MQLLSTAIILTSPISALSCLGNQSYINPCIDRLGDPNNSLCRAIDDQCYTDQYAIRHLLTALPAFWRFVQCWRCFYDSRRSFRHIVNAFKYSMCFIVLTFSTLNIWYKENVFFRLWIIAAIVNTLYTYIWDIKMDWGLLARDASGNKFLRANILYKYKQLKVLVNYTLLLLLPYKAFYYFAMAEDLILRLTWTLSMTVAETRAIDSEVLRTLLGFLEITRRSIWNFLRVEVEQIKIMSSSAKCSSSDNMEGELYGDEKITEVDGDKGVTNEAYSEESVTEEKQSSSSTTEEYRNKFRCSLWIARHWNESSYRQS
ncbi:XPR1 [Bugula neritina]|uniref:XPR1 n=1 Tax=Bugula neritina TaxID=10212 RepID=A0A7J7KPD6_BUGNE|nr:XPR1 [Bugula neritina]